MQHNLLNSLHHVIQDSIQVAFEQYRGVNLVEPEETWSANLGKQGQPTPEIPYDAMVTSETACEGPPLDFLGPMYSLPPNVADNIAPLPMVSEAYQGISQADSGYASCPVCIIESPNSCNCFEGLSEDPFAGELDEM